MLLRLQGRLSDLLAPGVVSFRLEHASSVTVMMTNEYVQDTAQLQISGLLEGRQLEN